MTGTSVTDSNPRVGPAEPSDDPAPPTQPIDPVDPVEGDSAPEREPLPVGEWSRDDREDDQSDGPGTTPIPAADPASPEGPISADSVQAGEGAVRAGETDPPTTAEPSDAGGAERRGWGWLNRTVPMWQVAVALVVVAGLFGVVAGLLSSGGGGGDGGDGRGQRVDAASDRPREQAVALDRLLSGSRTHRQAVVRAVVSLKGCRNLAVSTAALREAAASREALVAKLDTVTLSAISGGPRIEQALRTAWRNSAEADRAFARWGDQIAAAGCPGGQPRKTPAYTQGSKASAVASRAKHSFVNQWNKVASRYGLPQRRPAEI